MCLVTEINVVLLLRSTHVKVRKVCVCTRACIKVLDTRMRVNKFHTLACLKVLEPIPVHSEVSNKLPFSDCLLSV